MRTLSDVATDSAITPDEAARQAEKCLRAFQHFNRERMKIMFLLTPNKREKLVKLVPFLLHNNNRKLPGYVEDLGDNCGLFGFRADNEVKDLIKEFFPRLGNVQPQRAAPLIVSLATIGSAGTLAQTENSDFDFWITCDNTISDEHYKLVEKKAAGIHEWLVQLDPEIDVTFYMGTPDRVKRHYFGDVTDDSAGSALGKLLKEEFYRTCIVWAGQMPLWWTLPSHVDTPDKYEQWRKLLDESGFQGKADQMDMGPLERASPETFLGAVLWQTNKSLKQPFKSLLKLVLVDYYAHVPNGNLLAQLVRQNVQENPNDELKTDPYLALFELAAGYLREKRDFDGVKLSCESYYSKTITKVDAGGGKGRFTITGPEAMIQKRRRAVRDQMRDWGLDQASMMELNEQEKWDFEKALNYQTRIESFVKGIFDSAVDGLEERGFKYRHGKLEVLRDCDDADLLAMLNQFTNIGNKVDCFYGKSLRKVDPIPPGFQKLLANQTYSLIFEEHEPKYERWILAEEIYSGKKKSTSKKVRNEAEETVVAEVGPIVGEETVIDQAIETSDDEGEKKDTSTFSSDPLGFMGDSRPTMKIPDAAMRPTVQAPQPSTDRPTESRRTTRAVSDGDTKQKKLLTASSPLYLLTWLAANRLATSNSEIRASMNGERKPVSEMRRLLGKFAAFFRHPLYKDKLPDSTFKAPPAPLRAFVSFDLLAHSQFRIHERQSSRIFGVGEGSGSGENIPNINHITLLQQDTYGIVRQYTAPAERYSPARLMTRMVRQFLTISTDELERRVMLHSSDTPYHRTYLKEYLEAMKAAHNAFTANAAVEGLALRFITLVAGHYFVITRYDDKSWDADQVTGIRALLSYLERPLRLPVKTIVDPNVNGPERIRAILARWKPGHVQIFVHNSSSEPNSANIHVLDEGGAFFNERLDSRELDAQMGGLSFFIARLSAAPLKYLERAEGKLQYHVWRLHEIRKPGNVFEYQVEPQPREPSRATSKILTELVYVKIHGSLDLRQNHRAEIIARGKPRRIELSGATLVQTLAEEIDAAMVEHKCSNFCIVELGRSKAAAVRASQSIEYLTMRRALDRTLRRMILEKVNNRAREERRKTTGRHRSSTDSSIIKSDTTKTRRNPDT